MFNYVAFEIINKNFSIFPLRYIKLAAFAKRKCPYNLKFYKETLNLIERKIRNWTTIILF